ncbi:proteasome assembly chaperone family protein [Halocalculus aciditolerans]|nr:PAC2 family protein [Halocalculus aciditolerans]
MPDDARYSNDPLTHSTASFEVMQDTEPSDTLLAGFSQFGLAGLTAVDFLVDHLDLEQTGYVAADSLPAITPFENGTPRHHTRLFSRDGLDLTLLVNELFVPTVAADSFADAILDWTEANGVGEVAIASGVPVAHGPDEHRTYYVATDDYVDDRLAGHDVPPMGTGFLDGVQGRILQRGIDSDLAAGVYITPVHERVPDVEAAIRLTQTVSDVYGLDVDTSPLEAFAKEVADYYAELARRVEAVAEQQKPDDRMYV